MSTAPETTERVEAQTQQALRAASAQGKLSVPRERTDANATQKREENECRDQPPALLTVNDVAWLLNCSARTVYRLADSGRIPPPVRLGRLVRWSRRTLEVWLAEGCPACKWR